MITCDHCGKPTLAGAVSCQNCGYRLTNTISGGDASNMAPGMGTPGQPELPAWLETLRSGEGSAPPAAAKTGGTNYLADDFVDEGMLPSWMRPDRTVDNSPSDSYAARRPASQPAPDTDGAFLPTRGMSAGSLIDEQFLPSWMQESQTASTQAGQPAMPESISASSLVQPGVLPEWIRTIQPQSPASAPLDLMQNAQQANSSQPISGNDLIDQQALPQWMTGQNSLSGGPASLTASSLVDVHALPPWLREANQEQRRESAAAFSPVQPLPAPGYQQPVGQVPQYQPPDWQMPAPHSQVPNAQVPAPNYQPPDGQTPNMNSNLVAASLIDMNALPDWLRPAEKQQANSASLSLQQRSAENLRQASFGVPARPENVRVPSRPRGEMGYHEESEVAANAFASMLGVASAAPYFQGQQPRDAYGRPQGPAQPPQAFNAPAMGPLAGQGIPGMPPAAYQGGYPMGTMPGTPLQPPSSTHVPGMPSGPSSMNNGQSKPNAKPARRGIFDALRDFFFRS